MSKPSRTPECRRTQSRRRSSVGFAVGSAREVGFVRRLRCEILEDRSLLSVGSPQMELFKLSPALFVENRGQWADESIRYMHQGDGANIAMTDGGPVFQLFRPQATAASGAVATDSASGLGDPLSQSEPISMETIQFSARFVGANAVTPVGLNEVETKFNYFVGPRESWQSEVSSYQLISYPELYEGIELQTSGLRSHLKYEFHVAPGADYRQIRVHYEGIEGLSVAADGSLHVQTSFGELVDDVPYIYQVVDGQKVAIAGRFELLGTYGYTFVLAGEYDVSRELVIDPSLAWSTYLGGAYL